MEATMVETMAVVEDDVKLSSFKIQGMCLLPIRFSICVSLGLLSFNKKELLN